jgi:hypothetical protein
MWPVVCNSRRIFVSSAVPKEDVVALVGEDECEALLRRVENPGVCRIQDAVQDEHGAFRSPPFRAGDVKDREVAVVGCDDSKIRDAKPLHKVMHKVMPGAFIENRGYNVMSGAFIENGGR